ncbi:MAG: DUF4965 domain-containing protein [Prevotellaceae bacterium]|jgi:hypothetical protein|nr:DUF4965 domain-containing protein [Prevotellaceae bacterium]
MKPFLFLPLAAALFAACQPSATQRTANTLRAPAFPLITVDPYTSGWSFDDELYGGSVKHWTGENFPLIGAITIDGQAYRFMGVENRVYETVAPTAGQSPWKAAYTFAQPSAGWEQPAFNDAKWQKGTAAFGTRHKTAVNTPWEENFRDIWVRREVNLTAEDLAKPLYLHYSHDDDIFIYVNGVEVVNTGNACAEDRTAPLPEKAAQALKPGKNVLAAHCINRVGEAYVDLGLSAEAPVTYHLEQPALQTSVDVQATQTRYTFTCGAVDLELTFTAPLLPDNLEWVSRPVNYISYSVTPTDGAAHDVSVYFEASPAWAVNKAWQPTRAESVKKDGLAYLKTGSEAQDILGKKGDNVRIDWGYFYLCGEDTPAFQYLIGSPADLRTAFVQRTAPAAPPDSTNRHLAVVHSLGKVSAKASGKIMLGYDDLYSVQYFGENLRPYWNSDGRRDIFDAFACAHADYPQLIKKCNAFDAELMRKAADAGGKEYAELCALAYRQAIAAHKLVKAPNGDLLFLSKENFSNGSIGTVDITYPSAPLFLLYNTELCKGLLNHIFYYSESGKWTKPFAAHDVGTYPIANGQTYGGDMPIEESGNMLILTAAIAEREGNAKYAEKHWDVLTTWTSYLVEKGLDPENQLCTDDFAGHFAHNTNLSVKAILGIASYGRLAAMLGKQEVADEYTGKAKAMAQEWVRMADDGDHYRLTFDQPGTWSQKYNLVWNKLLNLDIFPKEVAQKEIPYYLTKQNTYGLPLDNRETYTKADWIVWTATLADDKATFEQFIRPLYAFAATTPDRVPMSDWYFTDRPNQRGFQARSVVGGYFIKLLEKAL